MVTLVRTRLAQRKGSWMAADRRCPACRVTILSAYNLGSVCAACLRAARDPNVSASAWVWDSSPIRRALAGGNLAAFMALLRGAAGLSQHELATLIGWSQAMVSMVERSQRDTLYDVRELLRVVDALDIPRDALLPLLFSDPDATLEAQDDTEFAGMDLGMGAMEMDRRTFSTISAGLAADALLPSARAPDRVDGAHVRYLRRCLQRVRNRYHDGGGGAVLKPALRQFARAKTMLDESDYADNVGRQLLIVTAELGEAAGWAAYDQNNQRLARKLYGEAQLLADSSGDAVVAVHVYTNLAQQSTYLAQSTGRRGLARESLRFANRAADVARHEPSPRLHALIALRQALAYAELGDEVAFRAAITTSRRELDRGPHEADPAWATYVSDSEITGYEALGYEAIGRTRRRCSERAPGLYRAVLGDTVRSARDQAYYRARLARALLNDGDVSLAIEEGTSILSSMSDGQMTSARSLVELRPLRAAAERAAAEEFCVRFDAAARALAA